MRALWRVVAVVIAALLTLTFAVRFLLIDYFFRRAGLSLGFALLEAVAIAGAGHLARRRRPGLALSFVIGYPVFGTVCFLVGLLKVNVATMVAVTVVFALAGIFAVYERGEGREESGGRRGFPSFSPLPSPLSLLPSPLSPLRAPRSPLPPLAPRPHS